MTTDSNITPPIDQPVTDDQESETLVLSDNGSSISLSALAKLMHSLANLNRLKLLLFLLRHNKVPVTQLAKLISAKRVNTSNDLLVLRSLNLVSSRPRGQSHVYSITEQGQSLLTTVVSALNALLETEPIPKES